MLFYVSVLVDIDSNMSLVLKKKTFPIEKTLRTEAPF